MPSVKLSDKLIIKKTTASLDLVEQLEISGSRKIRSKKQTIIITAPSSLRISSQVIAAATAIPLRLYFYDDNYLGNGGILYTDVAGNTPVLAMDLTSIDKIMNGPTWYDEDLGRLYYTDSTNDIWYTENGSTSIAVAVDKGVDWTGIDVGGGSLWAMSSTQLWEFPLGTGFPVTGSQRSSFGFGLGCPRYDSVNGYCFFVRNAFTNGGVHYWNGTATIATRLRDDVIGVWPDPINWRILFGEFPGGSGVISKHNYVGEGLSLGVWDPTAGVDDFTTLAYDPSTGTMFSLRGNALVRWNTVTSPVVIQAVNVLSGINWNKDVNVEAGSIDGDPLALIDYIYRIDSEQTELTRWKPSTDVYEVLDATLSSSIRGVAVSATQVFVADRTNVYSYNLDGTGKTTIVSSLTDPYGLQVYGTKLWIAESDEGKLHRCDLDGSNLEELIDNGGILIRARLNDAGNKIYCAEWVGGASIYDWDGSSATNRNDFAVAAGNCLDFLPNTDDTIAYAVYNASLVHRYTVSTEAFIDSNLTLTRNLEWIDADELYLLHQQSEETDIINPALSLEVDDIHDGGSTRTFRDCSISYI